MPIKERLLIGYLLLILNISISNAQINIDTASFYSIFQKINFESKNIVVIGELHGVKNTLSTEFFIIKNLAEKGYKTIYIEGGQSEAAIINMFLKSGDTSLLKYTRAREWSGAYKEFLHSIYQLNNEKRYNLIVKGFDFERPTCVGYLFSNWFGDAKINSIDFKKLSNYFLSIDAQESKSFKEINLKNWKLKVALDSVKKSFIQDKNRYKEILKDNFAVFKKIIFNPIVADLSSRNEYFTKSMLQNEKEESLDKSIIIIGTGHVLAKNSFIPEFSDILSGKYSLINFIFFYSNCQDLDTNKSKKISSLGPLKKLPKEERDKPIINFITLDKQIIPCNSKNIFTVAVGLYNQ